MIYGYARVSSADQNLERQVEALQAARVDDLVTEVVSTRKAILPKRDELISRLVPGDVLVVKELTRLGRSTLDVLATVDRIREAGAGLRTLDGALALDPTPNAMQTAILGLLTIIAQLERDLTRERQLEGIELAKRRKAYKGRARSLRTVDDEALAALVRSVGARRAALSLGVSKHTVNRELQRRKLVVTTKSAGERAHGED